MLMAVSVAWLWNQSQLIMSIILATPLLFFIVLPFENKLKIREVLKKNKLRYILIIPLVVIAGIIYFQKAYGFALLFIPVTFLLDFFMVTEE